jgi:hypothetical protein
MPMVYATLSIYSWSLFQFTLNLVVNRGRNMGAGNGNTASSPSQPNIQIIDASGLGGIDLARADSEDPDTSSMDSTKKKRKKSPLDSELLNVIITLLMQDGPFFILRLFCIFKFDIKSYLFLFFTFKNGILFSLQIYRIVAILTDENSPPPTTPSVVITVDQTRATLVP